MNKSTAYLYLFFTALTIFIGVRVYSGMNNTKNPNSIKSQIKAFEESLDENSEISR